ncbi:hypothetical protein [Streptomyces sp. NL15-2K]|uniref:hypothetical protein n=1 Tax=Streptomyces sp. NL15-2K TaxID=376149 RepID=UPI000FF9F5E5|nr:MULTISPECIES: hypothetical protein [Actinomycetes]WKX10463.1 hypothetical protein Q4V64_24310 [Kutzneria buriramensis]GCB48007.1 hypothetical protein SNL152K_5330 [Streptomyces sp. NL15-2K]
MSRFDELLGTDFDGQPVSDVEDVIYEALDDPRHRERVPGLVDLLNDRVAGERERFLACVALTTWAELAGFDAVIDAARDPERAPWYDILIDRKFSVDNTFAQLALAVSDSDVLAREKQTWARRTEAFRSLVRIADHEYFDEKLGDLLDTQTVVDVLPDIRAVVARGAASLAGRRPQRFDLATQLVDLAAAVATVDAATAVSLAQDVLSHDAGHRAFVHAVAIVQRAKTPETRQFADYLSTVGDDGVRTQVKQALG